VKLGVLIVISCVILALAGCGSDDSSAGDDKAQAADKAQTADDESQTVDDETPETDPKPKIQPAESPPKEVVIEDLEEGSGPAAKAGDELTVRFVAVDQTGKEVYDTWTQKEPLSFKLGPDEYGTGWDEGLTGVKAGGRRELSIPAAQSYEKSGPLYYVVKVIDVIPAGSQAGEGQAGGASPAR
jgi:peptidylprolyl isomerase